MTILGKLIRVEGKTADFVRVCLFCFCAYLLDGLVRATDLENIDASNRCLSDARDRHFVSPKHPLAIASLQSAACVIHAQLGMHLAASSVRLSPPRKRDKLYIQV